MNSCGCGSMPDMVTTSVQQLVVGDEGWGYEGGEGGEDCDVSGLF